MKRPSVSQLQFLYDHTADVLHVSKGHPILTNSTALDENVILQLDPQTEEIVGFSIIDFVKRFTNREEPSTVPLVATFEKFDSSTKRKRSVRKKTAKAGV
jgi:hypothetical protein